MNVQNETPKEAARRLSASAIRKGFKPEALHEYTDKDGKPCYWRIRLKHPETAEKWIRPLWIDGDRYVLREPMFLNGKPLYQLHELARRIDEQILFVEGEWCVDHLRQCGILATTSGAAGSAIHADFSPLTNRNVIIWPDNDDAGVKYAKEVTVKLAQLGCKVSWIDVSVLGLLPKGDAVDWLSANPQATAQDILALPKITPKLKEHLAADDAELVEENAEEHKVTQASALVAFTLEHAELFHDKNGDVYGQDMQTGETRRIDSRQFRDWLVANFYEDSGKAPRDQSIREALSTITGLGRHRSEEHDIFIRVAAYEGYYYLDLGEPEKNRAVCIQAGKWEIVENPPVRFIRSEAMRPLSEPERGGDIQTLWGMVNIPADCRLLVIAWLLECLRPDTPFPVLELIGEQGSAKSTTQTVLRRLIDPNACDLRAAPKTVEDVFVSAGVSWLVSYENISHLSNPMQDALCQIATGGGFAKRKLFTDAEESIITVKRPIVLNGISAAITAQDLIDRTLSIEMPPITERAEVTDLWRDFDGKHGQLLGALLDIMADVLARLPQIHLPSENRPRLLEFARFGMAIAQAMGETDDVFMRQFNASRQESIARTIDASPVATAIMEWIEQHPLGRTAPVKTLMNEIEHYKPQYCDMWPRTPKGFADAMRRAAPALRQFGIECRNLKKVGGVIRWEIKLKEKLSNPCLESPVCPDGINDKQDIKTCRTSNPYLKMSRGE